LHGDLDGAVETDDGGLDSVVGEVFSNQIRVGGGDAFAGKVFDGPVPTFRCGVAEARRSEAEREALTHGRLGFCGEIAAGDAEVEVAGADIDRDVLGPQEKELDVVGRVDDGEVFGIAAAPVAGLGENLGGGFAQCALVGYRDSQHHSFRYTSSRERPRAIISTCVQYSSWLISPAS